MARRSWWGVAAAALLALAACSGDGGGEGGGGADRGPIRIGAVLDVTGAGAAEGVEQRDTLRLLTDQLNASADIDGRSLELVVADDRSSEDEAGRAARRLVGEEEVDVLIGASGIATSRAVAAVAEEEKIPLISLAPVQDAKYVFSTYPGRQVVADELVQYLAAKDYRKVAVAPEDSPFGEGVPDLLSDLGAAAGVEVAASEPLGRDARAVLERLRKASPDAYLVWATPAVAASATTAYRDLGMDAPLLLGYGAAGSEFMKAAGEAANGVVFPGGKLPVAAKLPGTDPQKRVITAFDKRYQEALGRPPTAAAGRAWDAFNMAVNALGAAGTAREEIRTYLENLRGFAGITGLFNMSPIDHHGLDTSSLVMLKIANGAPTLAGKRL